MVEDAVASADDRGHFFRLAKAEIVRTLARLLCPEGADLEDRLQQEVLSRLDAQVDDVCSGLQKALTSAVDSQLLPAAREVLDSIKQQGPSATAETANSSAAGATSTLAATYSENMIECLPHGLLDQNSGNMAHLVGGSQASQPSGLPPRCRTSSSSGVAAHANSEQNGRMFAASDDGGPVAADLFSQNNAAFLPSGPRTLSPVPRSHVEAGTPPGATAPSSCSAASHLSSRGPSSRAPSPSMTTPAAAMPSAADVASTMSTPSWQSTFGHLQTPQQLFGSLGGGPQTQAVVGSPSTSPTPLAVPVTSKLGASMDDSFHSFGGPLENMGLGGLTSLGGQLRSASFAGDRPPRVPTDLSSNMRQLPFPLSALGLRQQQQPQQPHEATGLQNFKPSQFQQPPPQQPQGGGGILSDSLLAQLLAMDSQAHGAVQLSSAFPQVGGGGGVNALPGFDSNQMACLAELLAASRSNNANTNTYNKAHSIYMSAESTPECVSRSDSYAGQGNFLGGGPTAQMSPAAAVAAAGSLSLQQQQHLAMCQAKLQALQLQQQLHNQQQQHALLQQQQPSQQQLQFQQQLEAAALHQQQVAAALGGSRAFLEHSLAQQQQLGGGGSGGGGLPPQLMEMPKRLQVLPVSVQHKILEVVTKLPVLQLSDFDEKVVYKLSLLLDQFGANECINMLGHLMERIRKKDKSMMRNGPGYLDVAVSTHIDEMKALEKGAGVCNMPLDEYARQVLPPQLFEELREAVDSNRWLRWDDLDQGIVNVLKKMPQESAREKLQELTYHSFKNVDNTKGCIMSILNGRGDKWWARHINEPRRA